VANVASVFELNSLADTVTRGGLANCTLMACRAINTTGAAAYIQLFNAAAASDVTLGTTVPTWVVKSQASDVSDGDGLPTDGLLFPLGLFAASTTTPTGLTAAAQHVKIAIW
jgi:hypothetical protein